MEYYIKIDERRTTKKEQMTSDYSRIIKKMKKKRKLSYYYCLKNERMAELYKEFYNKKEITVPDHLVPKHKPEESKQEYQLRLDHSKQKLKQEIQILESRRETYEKKTKMMDNEIDTIIITKYENDPIKKEYFKNKWITECKMEELKSSQMWQAKEAYMRSKMYTLKTNANPFATPSKRRKHKLAKTESKQMGNTDCEVLIDSMKIQLRELEHDYIKEFEKKMHAEEGGKDFDESTLKKIGREIDKLEAALENVGKEEDNIIEKEKNSDTNNGNHKISSNNICSSTHFKTKIPLPIGKVMKARRRLNLTSDYTD